MKRGALFLAGVLTVSAILTACGGQESGGSAGSKDSAAAESTTEGKAKDSGEKVTISLLSWNTDEILGEFIAGFEQENPNIKIDLQYVPPVQQYVDKFSVLAASGQMTDMFYIAAENKQEVISKGVAEDISDMEIFSRIDPATSATYGKDGKIYGYSPDAWIGGIFYNKDLFEQAGIEKEPETWQEFVDCAAKLKAIGVEPYLDDADNVHNLAQDLYQCSVISQEPDADVQINEGRSTFQEKYTEPLKLWYDDMIAGGLYSQMALGLNSDQVIDMFANGEVAMMHGGPWNIATIEQKNPDMNYDIFGLSDSNGNRVLPGAVNVGLSISTTSAHKDACRAFIEYMARDENIVKWQKVTNNAIIVEGIDYTMGTVFEKFKEDAVTGSFYLPQIVWNNSSGIYKEFLSGIQDTITGADTIENIPVRLDEKQAELSQ
ncbi:MAG: extracellular solute-binding protein [Clostridiales bacterium]|mgnify:FL=1|uniref:ABC transporter substrate-binding protein n=1 Tax=Hungatella hathewayi TaxID=154046 RepID=A0AA37JIQ5_9FIRM|nr:extracellular solute-binding protein [Hungatella hathewayi]MCD7965872.1 extracellular solute-binding protein [Clostridiaceae bacterium]MCD7996298.1 extracellular solute-binding protein [Clostridiales bacterium]MBT9798087.1 extracellular solute-binding protein [Hungatella hathewayi]MCQ5387250.1 extracellular solute-binding protein [Hungatella hathewayi]RGZ03656.1 extracellular solute-binding protein [Hungatella hathewayi]